MTGPLWLPQTSEGQHPSLIPGIPMDNSDWDTSIGTHTSIYLALLFGPPRPGYRLQAGQAGEPPDRPKEEHG